PVRAFAADELSLDDSERQSAAPKANGDRLSGNAATKADDVELFDHLVYLRVTPAALARRQGCPRAMWSSIRPWYWFARSVPHRSFRLMAPGARVWFHALEVLR